MCFLSRTIQPKSRLDFCEPRKKKWTVSWPRGWNFLRSLRPLYLMLRAWKIAWKKVYFWFSRERYFLIGLSVNLFLQFDCVQFFFQSHFKPLFTICLVTTEMSSSWINFSYQAIETSLSAGLSEAGFLNIFVMIFSSSDLLKSLNVVQLLSALFNFGRFLLPSIVKNHETNY